MSKKKSFSEFFRMGESETRLVYWMQAAQTTCTKCEHIGYDRDSTGKFQSPDANFPYSANLDMLLVVGGCVYVLHSGYLRPPQNNSTVNLCLSPTIKLRIGPIKHSCGDEFELQSVLLFEKAT